MSSPTVWVMLHDLSRSGVPVVLERMLRATAALRTGSLHVVAFRDGPMRDAIEPLVDSVATLEPAHGRSRPGAAAAALRTLGRDGAASRVDTARWHRVRSRLPSPDVVLLHGAGAWPAVAAVPAGVPVVVHLHELDAALERCVPASERADFLTGASRVMVVARPVADLALRHGADGDRVVLVPGVADLAPLAPATDAAAASTEVLGTGRWVLGAGRPGWRKGTDRLAALAHELRRSVGDVGVGWVGGRPTGADAQWVDAADPVRWIDEMDDPWSVLSAASVIVVPSREDPLPLVALEAGRHRRPVVATATGGLPDLLAGGRGLVAEEQRLGSLSALVEQVLRSDDLAESLAGSLAEHVERHHDPEVVGRLWWDTIVDAAGSTARGRRPHK